MAYHRKRSRVSTAVGTLLVVSKTSYIMTELLSQLLALFIIAWGLYTLFYAVGLAKTHPMRMLGKMFVAASKGALRFIKFILENLLVLIATIFERIHIVDSIQRYFAGRLNSMKKLVEIQVSIPPDQKISREAAEQFLLSLPFSSRPLSFEIIGTANATIVQLVCDERDEIHLRTQLRSFFPNCATAAQSGYLSELWQSSEASETVIADFGLSREFTLPIRTFKSFDVDPLASFIGALEDLSDGELGLLQVLFQPVRQRQGRRVVRAVTEGDQAPPSSSAPKTTLNSTRKKVSRPLYATAIRVAAQAPSRGRAGQIVRMVGGTLRQFASPTENEFIAREKRGYEAKAHEKKLLTRSTRQSGTLLNSEELASLVHLPSASVRSQKLIRETKKTRAAPSSAVGHELVLGVNVHAGQTANVSLGAEERTRHMHVIGASGTGKSHLLLNLIIQDIENGNGIAVLDPHGDLIDKILSYIPEERADDVIFFDPADEEYPVGFNILSAHSILEKQLLASDLVAVFRRLSTSWGDQMNSVLANAILAFLESEKGGTLADMRRFLVEDEFRQNFLRTVADPEVVYYWQKEFPLLRGRPQAPLLTRLDTFLRHRLIRNIVSQKDNRLDFARMMDEGTIFLAKLTHGAIGEENAHLLGTLLMSKFYQTALSRQEIREEERRPYLVYIDEIHHFITPSLKTILSGARKYGLGLTLAHQDMQQIISRDNELATAVLTNPYTRICFRVGDVDAKKLASGFASFDAKDLQSLGRSEAICRIERADYDFNLNTLPLPRLDPDKAQKRRARVIARSRETYATPRSLVEASYDKRAVTHRPHPGPDAIEDASIEQAPSVQTTATEAVRPPKPASLPTPSREKRTAHVHPTPAAPRPSVPPTPGRGGREHKYLQELIKRWAESHKWRSSIEHTVLDGSGSVDVALLRDDYSIACEISVTSTPENELQNVEKCLVAGFDEVIVVSNEQKTLRKARNHIAKHLDEKNLSRVRFLTPEELFSYLAEHSASRPSTADVVGGYTVEVRYQEGSEAEEESRRQAVSEVIHEALQRMKKRST